MEERYFRLNSHFLRILHQFKTFEKLHKYYSNCK